MKCAAVLTLFALLQFSAALQVQESREVQSPGARHEAYYWAGKNGDTSRTGASASMAPHGQGISNGPTWSFQEHDPLHPWAKGLIRAAPLIDHKKNIYLATVTSGNIYKFSQSGEQLWKHTCGDKQEIPDIPAIMDGRLFASTNQAEVFALDMESGAKLWSKKVADRAAGDTWSMAASDGVVITAAVKPGSNNPNNNRLVALRASDGDEMWSFDTDGDIYNILVSIKDQSCVFSTSAGKVYRLSLASGRVIWKTPTPASGGFTTGGSVVGSDGKVYTTWNEKDAATGKSNGIVGQFDFKSGERLWKTDLGLYEANNAPAVGQMADGSLGVVVGIGSNPDVPIPILGIFDGFGGTTKKQRIVALNATSGNMTWQFDLPDYHGSALGDQYRKDICLPDAFGNSAIGGDGTAYMGHASGLLYSIKDSNNDGKISASEVSSWQTGAAFQGSPGIAPDMLVATPCNGMHVFSTKKSKKTEASVAPHSSKTQTKTQTKTHSLGQSIDSKTKSNTPAPNAWPANAWPAAAWPYYR